MYCPKCGNQADDSAAFCPSCGNDLNAARAAAQAEGAETAPMSTPLSEPHAPKAPMPMAETAPMAAAADAEAQAQYQAEMARYERDMAAWQAQHGQPGADSPDAATPAAGDAAEPLKKSRTGLVLGIIAAVLLLCACTTCGLWFAAGPLLYNMLNSANSGSTTVGTQTPQSSTDTSTSSLDGLDRPTTPGEAVDAWYMAVSSGELSTVKSLATTEFAAAIEPGMFEGRDPNTNYRVTGTTVNGDGATVDVAESSGDAPAQTAMTFTLAKQSDGTWRISGLQASALSGTTKTSPVPAAKTLTQAEAIDVVGRYLNAQKSGKNAEMKTYVTKRFLQADPGRFVGSAKEAFISFEVVKAVKKADAWQVSTKESWISGPETPTYWVILDGGKALIDNQTWPQ